ncbi:L-lactate dehydrogenase (cytochrome) [Noviherbaspirillum humi]|uniref:L-lactate dehydrogenase (Cytochrome) n=1 Tax=Noviherbaspirillum humi TaxID=1688639 RepID=A0A239JS80_9BURK|nr:L-lactate dehydrogenase (cytochrome) [Noviherbaspirillum humi]
MTMDPAETRIDTAAGAAAASPLAAPRRLRRLLSLDDFEPAARRHLPRPVFGYMVAAAETRRSLHANRSAFADYEFLPRVLVDVSGRTQETNLFGQRYASPFGLAPLGLSALSTYRGDLVMAAAAARAGVPMIMSGSSLIPMEQVAAQAPDAWFQAYLPGDEAGIEALIDRVIRAGFRTLVLTVDTQVPPNPENTARMGFSAPLRPSARLAWDGLIRPRWLFGTFLRTLLLHGLPHFENNYATRGAPILSGSVLRDFSERGHLSWRHFAQVRKQWPGKLVLKGVLRVEDACIARDAGADGIIVSNHGGRQLDGAIAPLRMLPDIANACADLPVMLDGGVRRGTDVLKALALGARMVFVGRPFGYAAAIGGEAGVRHAIGLLAKEVSRDMAMLGLRSLEEIRAADILRPCRPAGRREGMTEHEAHDPALTQAAGAD